MILLYREINATYGQPPNRIYEIHHTYHVIVKPVSSYILSLNTVNKRKPISVQYIHKYYFRCIDRSNMQHLKIIHTYILVIFPKTKMNLVGLSGAAMHSSLQNP